MVNGYKDDYAFIYTVRLHIHPQCVTHIQQSQGIRGSPTQTTSCLFSEEVYMEEAVLTCSMAPGQHLPQSAQPIIWHLVLLDRDLCGNSTFQQRLLICVMPVVWKGKTLISLWSPFSTLYGGDEVRCFMFLSYVVRNKLRICKMAKLSQKEKKRVIFRA